MESVSDGTNLQALPFKEACEYDASGNVVLDEHRVVGNGSLNALQTHGVGAVKDRERLTSLLRFPNRAAPLPFQTLQFVAKLFHICPPRRIPCFLDFDAMPVPGQLLTHFLEPAVMRRIGETRAVASDQIDQTSRFRLLDVMERGPLIRIFALKRQPDQPFVNSEFVFQKSDLGVISMDLGAEAFEYSMSLSVRTQGRPVVTKEFLRLAETEKGPARLGWKCAAL